MLREPDTLWLAFLYGLTFGGFVGLASFLTTFFHEQYSLSRVAAGDFTTIVVVAGSLLRPVGGWLSDRFGGYRLLVGLLAGFRLLPGGRGVDAAGRRGAWRCCSSAMGLLGMGNGAVFQLVPQRFPDRIGLVTGVVGAAGGLGGFFLPTLLGAVKDADRAVHRRVCSVVAARFALAARSCCSSSARGGRAGGRPTRVERTGVFRYRDSSARRRRRAGGVRCQSTVRSIELDRS